MKRINLNFCPKNFCKKIFVVWEVQFHHKRGLSGGRFFTWQDHQTKFVVVVFLGGWRGVGAPKSWHHTIIDTKCQKLSQTIKNVRVEAKQASCRPAASTIPHWTLFLWQLHWLHQIVYNDSYLEFLTLATIEYQQLQRTWKPTWLFFLQLPWLPLDIDYTRRRPSAGLKVKEKGLKQYERHTLRKCI